MTEVDSSLAQAVYYNENDNTMAIEFHETTYSYTGSAIYGEVPKAFYEGFVTLSSIGKTYNGYVKKTFPNISEGTVYDVDYVHESDVEDIRSVTEGNKDADEFTYKVSGYIRVAGSFAASSRHEAINRFLDSLTEDGYDEEDLAITEVEIVG